MAESLDTDAALEILTGEASLNGNAFPILGTIARLAATSGDDGEPRDLLIRTLEHRNELTDGERIVLDALTARLGLFPYVTDRNALSTSDQIALEFHRPISLEKEEFFFHSVQQKVYHRLLAGKNTILSAPTSFGKSVITDALVASNNWENIVILVPTLALIDETRRRLARFSDRYKINTFPSQAPGDRTLFIMTQERFLEVDPLPPVDLFVIDEFYKLDSPVDPERSSLLNIAWDRLRRTGAQFFLTGPNVTGLDHALPQELRESLLVTDFRTVSVDLHHVPPNDVERDRFLAVASEVAGSTLVYCRTPARVREAAEWLLSESHSASSPGAESAASWVAENYDPEWIAGRSLAAGIGLHHARIPRALQHHTVRLFNNGSLGALICTSTLIEGVNTAARNVLVLDGVLNRKPLDYFTFSNIRGRAGRMFRHFVGQVYLFSDSPEPEDKTIDIPITSQSTGLTDSTLLQIPPEDLSDYGRERLKQFSTQRALSLQTLRANKGVDPTRQIALANTIRSGGRRAMELLSWTRTPSYEQTVYAADLILSHLVPPQQRGRVSASSLATRLNAARRAYGDIPEMVEAQLRFSSSRDEAVEDVLFFLRNWMGHIFPSSLIVLERVQREVLSDLGYRTGAYAFYARQIEDWFLPHHFVTLEEYGLPVQVAVKLQRVGLRGDSLDDLLSNLRVVAAHPDVNEILSPFESEMLDEVIAGLGPVRSS